MTDYAETLLKAHKACRLLTEYAERGDNLRAQWQAEQLAHCGIALEQFFDARQRGKSTQTAQIEPTANVAD